MAVENALNFDVDTNKLINFIEMVRGRNFVILDTETTGLHRGEICEIAIIDAMGNTLLDQRVKTVEPIPLGASNIHGITDSDVKDCPMWREIQPKVREILRGKNVVIYNSVYDRKMMHQSDERNGMERVDYKSESVFWCAMEAYAGYHGDWNSYHQSYKWQKLTSAALHMGVEETNAHSALGDCLMTLGVIKAMANGITDTFPDAF